MHIAQFDSERDGPALLTSLDSGDVKGLLANQAAIEDGDSSAFVAIVDGETVAWAMAILRERNDYGLPPDNAVVEYLGADSAYLVHLEVRRDFRGIGIGSALLASIENAAMAEGKHTLWLHTAETDAGSQRFYEDHGWIHQDTTGPASNAYRVYSKDLQGTT